MKIFYFSTVFAPSVGGIERITELLCSQFAALGHEVRLATLTPGCDDVRRSFEVIRRPSLAQFIRLLRWCDVHTQASVSLKFGLVRLFCPRSFVYSHHSVYQRDDGTLSLRDGMKRFVARRTPGIAVSHFTADKVGCTHVVHNAYDDSTFRQFVEWTARDRELVFLGRLVSHKGCSLLLRALGDLRRRGMRPSLTVIGDGPDRPMLQELAARAGAADQVRFEGILQGEPLAAALNRHRVLVVPSTHEEPFPLVALEGLACGCLPVVSERGGLVEGIGPHGYTFPNGDAAALADTLAAILAHPDAAQARLAGRETHLAALTARAVAERYVRIFEDLLERRR